MGVGMGLADAGEGTVLTKRDESTALLHQWRTSIYKAAANGAHLASEGR